MDERLRSRFPDGQNLIDQINSIVEESMQTAGKAT